MTRRNSGFIGIVVLEKAFKIVNEQSNIYFFKLFHIGIGGN